MGKGDRNFVKSLTEDVTDAFKGFIADRTLVDNIWVDVQYEHVAWQDATLGHQDSLVSGLREVLKNPTIALNVALLYTPVKEFHKIIITERLALHHGTYTEVVCVDGIAADVALDDLFHIEVDGARLCCDPFAKYSFSALWHSEDHYFRLNQQIVRTRFNALCILRWFEQEFLLFLSVCQVVDSFTVENREVFGLAWVVGREGGVVSEF